MRYHIFFLCCVLQSLPTRLRCCCDRRLIDRRVVDLGGSYHSISALPLPSLSSCTWLYLHRTPFPLRTVNIMSLIMSIVCADWGVASQCESRARPLDLSGDRERSPAARKGTIFTVQLLAIPLIQFIELFDFCRGGRSFILTLSILPKE
jgi:hypothetical protein